MIDLLYQDNRILVCIKPFGVRSTDEPGGLPGLLREQLGNPNACVRTVHRLDQVVGGAMVLARSRESTKRLSAQVQGRTFFKEYLAVVHGAPPAVSGELRDLLVRNKAERKTYVTAHPSKEAQEAALEYQLMGQCGGYSLVRIHLLTGRTHQIRAQFSAHGCPIYGDKKYSSPVDGGVRIALWSHKLGFVHPQTEEPLSFSAPPPRVEPWTLFYRNNGEVMEWQGRIF